MIVILIILKILLYLLLFILGLALLLLILPFNYAGQVLAADGLKAQFALGWAWKLLGINAEIEGEDVNITLRVLNKKVYKFKGKTDREEEEQTLQQPEGKEKEKKKKDRKGPKLKELADRTLINEILEYFRRVLNIAKPKYLHIYGTYGFDDPSLTGIVCGITGIIKSMIPHARLHLTPDFTQEVMDLDLRAEGSMVVGSIAYQTIRTVLKKPVRKILFRKKKS